MPRALVRPPPGPLYKPFPIAQKALLELIPDVVLRRLPASLDKKKLLWYMCSTARVRALPRAAAARASALRQQSDCPARARPPRRCCSS